MAISNNTKYLKGLKDGEHPIPSIVSPLLHVDSKSCGKSARYLLTEEVASASSSKNELGFIEF